MATIYGSAVSSTSNPPQNTNSAGYAHARKRETMSHFVGVQPTTSDVMVISLIKSSDRIKDVKFFTNGAGTNGALNIGLHKVTQSNGALSLTAIDVDLFATGKATGTAILYDAAAATVFTEAGTVGDVDRGKAAWVLADLGGGTYTADPGEVWAITATPSVSEDASSNYIFEVEYVAGD